MSCYTNKFRNNTDLPYVISNLQLVNDPWGNEFCNKGKATIGTYIFESEDENDEDNIFKQCLNPYDNESTLPIYEYIPIFTINKNIQGIPFVYKNNLTLFPNSIKEEILTLTVDEQWIVWRKNMFISLIILF